MRVALLACGCLMVGAVLLSACLFGSFKERPYEERAYQTAALQGRGSAGVDGRPWSEHPPVARLPWFLAKLFSTPPSLRAARLVTCVARFATFLILLRALLSTQFSALPGQRRSDMATTAPAVVAAASITASPALVAHACRADGLAVAECAFAAMLLFAVVSSSWSCYGRMAILVLCGTIVTWASSYGVVFASSLIVAATLLKRGSARQTATDLLPCCPRRDSQMHRALPIAGVLLVAAPLLLFDSSLVDRLARLSNHHWGTTAFGDFFYIPYSFHWYVASVFDVPHWVPDAIQVALLVLIFPAPVLGLRPLGRSAAICCYTVLMSAACLMTCEWVTAARIHVPHFLGIQHILLVTAAFTAARDRFPWGGAWAIAGLACAGGFVPSLATVSYSGVSGDSVVRIAADEIHRRAAEADYVVFAGSRTFILLYPELTVPVRERSFVYFREGLYPDDFVAANLIPFEQRVRRAGLKDLEDCSIVYVQLEAAQSITFPTTPWEYGGGTVLAHPAHTIGDIYIMSLRPRPNRTDGQTRR